MKNADIMAFVEDPGAANMVVNLGAHLAERNLKLDLWAAGAARDHFVARHLAFNDVGEERPFHGDARLVVIGTSETPDSLGFEIAARARKDGITTVGLVDSPASAAARFRGTTADPLAHLPDHLVVTDAVSRNAFLDLGVEPGRIAIAANPALLDARARAKMFSDGDRNERRRVHFGDGEGPVIVFLAELSDGLDPVAFRRSDAYSLSGRGGSDARTDIVLETLLDSLGGLSPRPRVVLRLHPKESPDAYAAYTDEIAGVSAGGDALELCDAADLVVGLTTTLLSETRQTGQRVMSIVPRAEERYWLADLATGAIPCAHEIADVAPMIERLLAQPRVRPDGPDGSALADVLAGLLPDRKPTARAGVG